MAKTKAKKWVVMFLDYTGLPRAWGAAFEKDDAEKEARRQLDIYCEKKKGLGEPDLSDPSRFSMRATRVEA